MRDQTIIVVGGAGYLGSVLCTKLIEQSYKVICVDRYWFRHSSISHLVEHKNFQTIKLDDNFQYNDLEQLKDVTAIINLAGLVGDPACALDKSFTDQQNYKTAIFWARLAKAHGIRRYIFASSCSVYGDLGNCQLSEDTLAAPVSYYAEDKLRTEKAIQALADRNFSPTFLRLSTLFGWSYRMRFDLVVNRFVGQAFTGEELMLHGGSQWRPFLHVNDAAQAFILTLQANETLVANQVFNVGGNDNNTQLVNIVQTLKDLIHNTKVSVLDTVEDRRTYNVDFSKIADVLGYRLKFSITEGIKDLIDKLDRNDQVDIHHPIYNNYLWSQQMLANRKMTEEVVREG
ncbi:NAD-dependent epimerase/dehydratase family protein [Cysteiniphilum halobium]|uniref:NAD-dependent epimerase/dehydratase family protein n=1 Tax=Cysteiniphilum halobium TaxID=2219059 RepID=UPI003F82DF22